jgi:hypothetical protein
MRAMRSAAIQTREYERDERREAARREGTVIVLSSAELVECNCPDACDRDHDRD